MSVISRSPLVHFLVLGGALFALAHARAGARTTAVEPLVLVPGESRRAIDEEILLHEARRAGLDRRDPVVRERLSRLAAFVGETGEDPAALEREARRLGLDRSDVVVRRHLVQMMELALAREHGPAPAPTDAALADYLARHAADFVQPARVRLTHVFFARAHAGRAAAVAARLRREHVAPADAPALGDAFWLGAEVAVSEPELDRVFGPSFAAHVRDLPPGEWSAPIPSAYGMHVVWIGERGPGRLPALAEVRERLRRGLEAERAARRLDDRLAVLRAAYGVGSSLP